MEGCFAPVQLQWINSSTVDGPHAASDCGFKRKKPTETERASPFITDRSESLRQ